MKYSTAQVVFAEIPEEITLAINISGCPNRCPGCHSQYLWEDIGQELNIEAIDTLLDNNKGVSCICFMGGDQNPLYIMQLAEHIRYRNPDLKIGWYSGKSTLHESLLDKVLTSLNYLKLGPFLQEYGPLDKQSTNQRFYKIENKELVDITFKFWKYE